MEPVVRREIEGAPNPVSDPGSREEWRLRPPWHGLIYGNGKRGSGTESVVNPDAMHSWPVVFDATGKIRRPPEESKHRNAVVATEDGRQAKRHRRTTSSLTMQVADLAARGMVVTAIADALNISDRRTKQILRGLPTAA